VPRIARIAQARKLYASIAIGKAIIRLIAGDPEVERRGRDHHVEDRRKGIPQSKLLIQPPSTT